MCVPVPRKLARECGALVGNPPAIVARWSPLVGSRRADGLAFAISSEVDTMEAEKTVRR
jgi:hypothetical protein